MIMKNQTNTDSGIKKHIVVIYTGGTMGTEQFLDGKRQTICSVERFRKVYENVLKLFRPLHISYELCRPKDSTERDWRDVEILYEAIAKWNGRCSAILVIYGTDSMAYAASLISLGLLGTQQGLVTPVVFCGSQSTPMVLGRQIAPTDAYNNLALALKVALEADRLNIADVLLSFGDRILRGITAVKISEAAWNAFDCPGFRPVGNADSRIVGDFAPSLFTELCRNRFTASGDLAPKVKFGGDIVNLIATTNLPARVLTAMIEDKSPPHAIVISAMGEGNVRSTGADSLLTPIRVAQKRGIPICLASPFAGGAVSPTNMHYPSGLRALKAGAIPCGSMTIPAIVAKLAFLHANGLVSSSAPNRIKDYRRWFARDLVGELSGGWPKSLH